MADASQFQSFRDEVNYNEMKRKYIKHIEMYYNSRKLNVSCPYTRKVLDRIISVIKDAMALKERGHRSEHPKYRITNKYDVISEDGKEFLVTKPKSKVEPVLKVVPAEECFDIILEAHVKTNHGSRDRILRCIEANKYSVPKTSVDFILALCNKCQHHSSVDIRRKVRMKVAGMFSSRAQVSVIDMHGQTDNDFKYILFYVDRCTKFMILRPLLTNTPEEVATELLKIFFDFGPPEKLEAYNRSFFNKVLSLVVTFFEDFNIMSTLPVTVPEIGPQDVRSMIKKWQIETGTKNWAIGCYILQWKYNCSTDNANSESPYYCVFGTEPSYGNDSLRKEPAQPSKSIPDKNIPNKSRTPENEDDFQIVDDSSDEKVVIDNDADADAMEEDDMIIITEPPIMYVPAPSLPPVEHEPPAQQSKPIILKRFLAGATLSKVPEIEQNNTLNLNSGLEFASKSPQAGSPKPEPNLDTAIASSYIDAKTGQSTTVASKTQNEKAKTMLKNTPCHVCKTEISRPYNCMKCKRKVHLFCSDRLLQQGISQDVLDVICTSCKFVNTRYENLKRKFNSIVNNMD